MAGTSKRPLAAKLGIKEGARIVVLDAPHDYFKKLGKLPRNAWVVAKLDTSLDLIHCFVKERQSLKKSFPALKRALSPNGSLWISWPKGSSRLETDLNENVIRNIGLKNGLVDVKVCAVDDTWSGLKFVYRLKDRK